MFGLAQFDAADLAGDGLGQVGEFEAADALVRRETGVQVLEDRQRGFRRAVGAGGQRDVGLGHRETDRIGGGHHGGFGDGGVLDQHGFQFEGRDAVVACLEHVIGAADIGEVAVGVAAGDVAGAVYLAGDRFDGAIVELVAAHQAGRAVRERDGDFALV